MELRVEGEPKLNRKTVYFCDPGWADVYGIIAMDEPNTIYINKKSRPEAGIIMVPTLGGVSGGDKSL